MEKIITTARQRISFDTTEEDDNRIYILLLYPERDTSGDNIKVKIKTCELSQIRKPKIY